MILHPQYTWMMRQWSSLPMFGLVREICNVLRNGRNWVVDAGSTVPLQ